jgi:hypothetical protein
MEKLALIGQAAVLHHLAQSLDACRQWSTQGAYRPVAAEDHATGAKFRQDMVIVISRPFAR